MKLRLGLLAWAGALDPAWNPDRPLRNTRPSSAFTAMSDILDRRRYDKDLYDRLDQRFFRNGNATKTAAYHPFVGEHQDKSAVMRDDGSVAMKLTGR